MDDLGCKSVDISSDLNDFDIELINRYINQDLNWENLITHYLSNIIL